MDEDLSFVIESSRKLLDCGQYLESINLLTPIYDRLKSKLKTKKECEIVSLLAVSKSFQEQSDGEEDGVNVRDLCAQSFQFVTNSGESLEQTEEILENILFVYEKLREFMHASDVLECLVKLRADKYGPSSQVVLLTLYDAGICAVRANSLNRAENSLEECLRVSSGLVPDNETCSTEVREIQLKSLKKLITLETSATETKRRFQRLISLYDACLPLHLNELKPLFFMGMYSTLIKAGLTNEAELAAHRDLEYSELLYGTEHSKTQLANFMLTSIRANEQSSASSFDCVKQSPEGFFYIANASPMLPWKKSS